jgi:hypothetical protein
VCVHIYDYSKENSVCTACSRTSYKIVPLNNLNKYLHYDTGEAEININIDVNKGSENSVEKYNTTSGKIIIASHASVVNLYVSCTCVSGRLEYNSRFVGRRVWGEGQCNKFGCKSVDDNWDGLSV